ERTTTRFIHAGNNGATAVQKLSFVAKARFARRFYHRVANYRRRKREPMKNAFQRKFFVSLRMDCNRRNLRTEGAHEGSGWEDRARSHPPGMRRRPDTPRMGRVKFHSCEGAERS